MTRDPPAPAIRIRDARQHNLTGIDVDIPLAGLTVITGVSGSLEDAIESIASGELAAGESTCEHGPSGEAHSHG